MAEKKMSSNAYSQYANYTPAPTYTPAFYTPATGAGRAAEPAQPMDRSGSVSWAAPSTPATSAPSIPATTGGFSSVTGESLIVTPTGKKVASAELPAYTAPSTGTVSWQESNLISSGLFGKQESIESESLQKEYNIIAPEEKKKGIEGWSQSISQQRNILASQSLRGEGTIKTQAVMFGLGVASVGVGTALLAKGLVTSPITTITGTIAGFKELIYNPSTIKNVIIEQPGYATGIVAGTYLTGKAFQITKPIVIKPLQQLNVRINPRGVLYSESGVRVVESTTIPTKSSELLKFEGKRIDTVHMTSSTALKPGSILTPPSDTSAVGPFRKSIQQFNFFQSTPSGKTPILYGGYVGIGEGVSSGKVQFSLFGKTPKAFIFRQQEITATPEYIKALDIKSVVEYQTVTPGTYIPGENIKGMSIEGQVTTSVGKAGSPIFKIAENPEGPLFEKFTYYNVKRKAPSFIESRPLLKKTFDIFTSKNEKILFKEAKIEQIGKGEVFKKSDVVDVVKYSESYGSRSVSVASYSTSVFPSLSLGYKSPTSKSYSQSAKSINKSLSKGLSYSSKGYSLASSFGYSGGSISSGYSGGSGGSFSSGYSGASIVSSGYGSYADIPPILSPPVVSIPGLQMGTAGRKPQSKGRKYAYTPSLAALGFNLKSTVVPKDYSTGLVLRTIVTPKRRSRR